MRTIWKFTLPAPQGAVEMPQGAVFQHFGLDPRGLPCVWALVDSDAPRLRHECKVVGTGQPVPDGAEYVGTYLQGLYVLHAFLHRSRAWSEHAGGEAPNVGDVNVDISYARGLVETSRPDWTGPASVADWSAPCFYRISADQPQ